jgi:hypothetical protein
MHVTRLRARLGCALASTVVVASLLAAAGCTSLPSVELGGCGDGIVEPERGEDCDRGGDCGAPGTAQACRLTCTVTTDCPAGAVCGATGVCSVPAARFERADGDELPFTSRFLIASDVDDDGDADLIGVDDVAVAVRAGAAGATFAPPVMLPGVPVQGLPVAADFTGDGADDVVFSAGIGTEVLTAANAGSFEPTFQPTFNLGGTGGFVANTIVYAQPAPDDGRDAAVGSLVVAVDLAPGAACPNGCSVLSIDDEAVLMPGHADALLVPRLPIAQVRTPANPAREEFVVALPFADSNPNLPGDQDGLFLARAQTGLNPGDAATLSPPAPVTLPTGAKLVGATFADLDGLAGRELVVSYTVAQVARLAIAVGRADGTFGALTPVSFAGGVVAPTPLAFVDVTPGYYDELLAADGVSLISCDLIAASCERTSVSAASVPWQDVAVGDLDGDGFTDVVAARKSTSTIDVRLGTGLPFFWNPASMSAPGEVKAIRVGDFDGNDVADVAVAFSTDGTGSAVDLAMAFGAYLAPPTAPVRIARIGKLLALEPSQQVALGLDLVEDLLMVFERGGTRSGSVLLGSATRNLIAPQLPTGEGQPVGVESLTVEAVVATPVRGPADAQPDLAGRRARPVRDPPAQRRPVAAGRRRQRRSDRDRDRRRRHAGGVGVGVRVRRRAVDRDRRRRRRHADLRRRSPRHDRAGAAQRVPRGVRAAAARGAGARRRRRRHADRAAHQPRPRRARRARAGGDPLAARRRRAGQRGADLAGRGRRGRDRHRPRRAARLRGRRAAHRGRGPGQPGGGDRRRAAGRRARCRRPLRGAGAGRARGPRRGGRADGGRRAARGRDHRRRSRSRRPRRPDRQPRRRSAHAERAGDLHPGPRARRRRARGGGGPVMRAIVATMILAVLAASTAPAGADDRKTAEKHFRTGERLFTAGDFVHAAGSFEQAYATLPLPAIAFSAAQAYRLAWAKAKDKDPALLQRAVALYRIYVEQDPSGDRVVEASAALGDLEPLLGKVTGTGAAAPAIPKLTGVTITSALPGVKVAIDGAAPVELPLVKELAVGAHTVVATAPGYAERTLPVATVDGALVPVEIELDALPARVTLALEAGSTVAIDGRATTGDVRRGVAVPAGRHLVTVTRRGRRAFAQEFEVGRGEAVAITARQPVTSQRRIATWVLYGAGALTVGAGVAGTFAYLSDADAAALADRRATRGLSVDEVASYEALRAERDDRRALAYGLAGGALAVGFTGALLYWFDRDEPRGLPALAPTVSGDGAGVVLGGAF